MQNFNSLEEILDFAIRDEIRASNLYADLAKKSRNKEIKKVFEQFSQEELGHKRKLERMKYGDIAVLTDDKVQDLKIGDYLVEVDANRDDLSYQDALIIAMKEEKAAFKLYSELAERIDDDTARDVFLLLAKEEARHKLRFEIEYDEYILNEN
jgi:rubrerythrin